MEQYSITMEPRLVQAVDSLVQKEGLYNSRNDFIRDAIRARILEVRKAEIDRRVKIVADRIRARGITPRMPTEEERQALFEEFVKEVKARTPSD